MAPADSVPREPAPCSPPPDSSPESYLLPTRPARRPAPYASDTSPGVTPPSGPFLIFVCIQPSPWARRSVGAVEHGGSRFLRQDPPPWWGRRGSDTFSTSHECSRLGQGLDFSGSPVPTSPPVATVGPAVPYCLPHNAPSFVYS